MFSNSCKTNRKINDFHFFKIAAHQTLRFPLSQRLFAANTLFLAFFFWSFLALLRKINFCYRTAAGITIPPSRKSSLFRKHIFPMIFHGFESVILLMLHRFWKKNCCGCSGGVIFAKPSPKQKRNVNPTQILIKKQQP